MPLNEGNGVLFKLKRRPAGHARRPAAAQVLARRAAAAVQRAARRDVARRPAAAAARGGRRLRRPRAPPPALRPGLTGLWQVSGRSDLSWEESLRLDLRYVDNWSMALDLQILLRTFRAVVHGAGAY